ncbi:MAG: hypothetical protein V2A79_10000 [Planctomycetota bacterium]
MLLTQIDKNDIAKLCPLDGITVTEVRIHDAQYLQSIRLEDGAGHVMVVACSGEYSSKMQVLLKAPPQKVTKWRLAGKITGGVEIHEEFEAQDEAHRRRIELAGIHTRSDLEIEEIETLIEQEG